VARETRVVPNPANFGYDGVVHDVSPPEFTITLSTQYMFGGDIFNSVSPGDFISDAQKFSISITGLKPKTRHKFMFDGEDQTSKCAQSRTSTINTTGLLTDANGTLNFDFFFDAGINEATSDFEQQNKLAAAKAGTKVFIVESYDGNSKTTGSIGMKYYTNIPTNIFEPVGLNTSQTGTMLSTSGGAPSDISLPGTEQIPAGFASQDINDAIDRNNIRFVAWDNRNEQLQ
jgi:hypothetical protein